RHVSLSPHDSPVSRLPQEAEAAGQVVAPGSEVGEEGVTDVIQQLLELSEQVTGDAAPAQQPAPEPSGGGRQYKGVDVARTQSSSPGWFRFELRQALENSGLSVVQSNGAPVQPQGPPAEGAAAAAAADTKKSSHGPSEKSGLSQCSIREENGVRWHGCPYCSKEFKKPSDLVRHIRIHTHEKPFKCKQCFRAFAVKSTLTAHMKTHTGVKAFECPYCRKCFSTSGSMWASVANGY
ncbi:hypothetical protein CRUP_026625, partial [Coryphaenoides rupestris]